MRHRLLADNLASNNFCLTVSNEHEIKWSHQGKKADVDRPERATRSGIEWIRNRRKGRSYLRQCAARNRSTLLKGKALPCGQLTNQMQEHQAHGNASSEEEGFPVLPERIPPCKH
jgi:hypothetical protein